MRDVNRLDSFYDNLKEVHKTSFPDWRFGQLMSNFLGWIYEKKRKDFFFIEEPEMSKLLLEYATPIKGEDDEL